MTNSPIVTEADRKLRREVLAYLIETINKPCVPGDGPDERNDHLDEIFARHREKEAARSADDLPGAVNHHIEVTGKLLKGLSGAEPFKSVAVVEAAGRSGSRSSQLSNLSESVRVHGEELTARPPRRNRDTLQVPCEPRMDPIARLVIAARVVAFERQDDEALRELDQASEAFASSVPWERPE